MGDACGKPTTGPLDYGQGYPCARAAGHDGVCRSWLTGDETRDAELAALRADLARVTAERDAAFDRGRQEGRADVAKYSNAIGRIEASLGIAGAMPLGETVAAVDRLARERDALSDAAAALHAEERPVRTQVRLMRAQVRELLKVALAAAKYNHTPNHSQEESDAHDELIDAVDTLPPSMLEEPSDG